MILQVSKGFFNWKDAIVAFRQHEKSACHKEAVEMLLTLPANMQNIGEMLSSTLAKEQTSIALPSQSTIKFVVSCKAGLWHQRTW